MSGNYGCHGGNPHNAFLYAIEHGMTYENSYPYLGKELNCKAQTGDIKVTKQADILSGDCNTML